MINEGESLGSAHFSELSLRYAFYGLLQSDRSKMRLVPDKTALIEELFLNPAVKKAIILLLYRTFVKVLKDALAHLGPY